MTVKVDATWDYELNRVMLLDIGNDGNIEDSINLSIPEASRLVQMLEAAITLGELKNELGS
jgi:hypothetical protein